MLQPVLLGTAQWTEDGLVTARALGLVAAGLTSEHAATLRLRMAASIAMAMQSAHAIRKPVQVCLDDVMSVWWLRAFDVEEEVGFADGCEVVMGVSQHC